MNLCERDRETESERDRNRCDCSDELEDIKKVLSCIACQLDRIANALENERRHHCR
ncbi:MAG: hypothetical protein GX285_08530 [Clostridiales bacterium]|nr:hypothetical protein [Clostridiales bacterium]